MYFYDNYQTFKNIVLCAIPQKLIFEQRNLEVRCLSNRTFQLSGQKDAFLDPEFVRSFSFNTNNCVVDPTWNGM